MRLDPNPFFRKAIVPWYDSWPVCYIIIFVLFIFFLFSLAGILVACEIEGYRDCIWVPLSLAVLSGAVIFSTLKRLIKRYLYKFYK